jgi:N-acetyl-gamma-glutamyl-phosphate reductase
VIDLSADFRIADLSTYEKYYGRHHAPELLPHARFVLPELTPPAWRQEARVVAAPGCYPTSILVPLVPLLRAGIVSREHIVVNSCSGVSGAGKKAEETYLFCERAESMKAYGLVKHRHLAEIEEQLAVLAGAAGTVMVVAIPRRIGARCGLNWMAVRAPARTASCSSISARCRCLTSP